MGLTQYEFRPKRQRCARATEAGLSARLDRAGPTLSPRCRCPAIRACRARPSAAPILKNCRARSSSKPSMSRALKRRGATRSRTKRACAPQSCSIALARQGSMSCTASVGNHLDRCRIACTPGVRLAGRSYACTQDIVLNTSTLGSTKKPIARAFRANPLRATLGRYQHLDRAPHSLDPRNCRPASGRGQTGMGNPVPDRQGDRAGAPRSVRLRQHRRDSRRDGALDAPLSRRRDAGKRRRLGTMGRNAAGRRLAFQP